MSDRRWVGRAIFALVLGLALLILPNLLVAAGAPMEAVSVASLAGLVAMVVALVILGGVASRRPRWSMVIGATALGAEIAGALLLLVQEPQPAYLHPEWAWYWPVVNTLYFGGLVLAIVGIVSAAINVAATRSAGATAALFLAAGAAVVNRIAPYR